MPFGSGGQRAKQAALVRAMDAALRATIHRNPDWRLGDSDAERHEYLHSGKRVDKHWWYAIKLGAMILAALAAAYLVHTLLLT